MIPTWLKDGVWETPFYWSDYLALQAQARPGSQSEQSLSSRKITSAKLKSIGISTVTHRKFVRQKLQVRPRISYGYYPDNFTCHVRDNKIKPSTFYSL